jgi:diphthamide biosynthesis protein 7
VALPCQLCSNHTIVRTEVQSIPVPHAIFDLRFSPRQPYVFAVATSEGTVELYRTISLSETPTISHIRTIRVHDDPSVPVLYLDWAPVGLFKKRDLKMDAFAVSFSDGSISVIHTNPPDYEFREESISNLQFTGSMSEIWDVKFSSTGDSGIGAPLLFSGDDFGNLRAHEFGMNGEWTDGDFPMKTREFDDRGRNHNAGLTAILPLCNDGPAKILLTGSYDEYVRIYRYKHRGTVLAEKSLGGGVWRLRLLKTKSRGSFDGRSYIILASCMHAGARIIRVNSSLPGPGTSEENWNIEVIAEFTEHTSMNYASGVWRRSGEEEDIGQNETTDIPCVSTSFYDRRLCLWKFDL